MWLLILGNLPEEWGGFLWAGGKCSQQTLCPQAHCETKGSTALRLPTRAWWSHCSPHCCGRQRNGVRQQSFKKKKKKKKKKKVLTN